MRTSLVVGAVLLGVGAVLVSACVKGDECDFGGCSGPTADGGNDGPSSDAPGIDAPPGCDLTKGPSESAACIDDSVGVFVSASGDDGATGKKASPVKTIGKGLELAAASGLPRVYVCEGTYDTAAEIKAPVDVYGGLSCAWAYTGNKPKLAPANGVALKVTSVSGVVSIQDLEIDGSADKEAPGSSAIATFISQSTNVTLTSVTLSAGEGVAGAPGSVGSNYTGATATAGTSAADKNGGAGAVCTCADGTKSTGGDGATVGGVPKDGSANPAVGVSNAGSSSAMMCDPASAGANGPAGSAAAQTNQAGVLTADGWQPVGPAAAAPNGHPAQGGGGGGARTNVPNLGGGGGGCGGCGGAGGTSGTAGGSSFALLIFQSSVKINGSALSSGSGGKGGKGGAGQPGQGGGALGTGICDGGTGGIGAGGSGGSGGAGGYSAAIAYMGAAPSTSGAALTPGAVGIGGDPGGAGPAVGSGNAGAAGVKGGDGQSMPMLALAQ